MVKLLLMHLIQNTRRGRRAEFLSGAMTAAQSVDAGAIIHSPLLLLHGCGFPFVVNGGIIGLKQAGAGFL